MKVRKIMQLKQLHIIKNQILDISRIMINFGNEFQYQRDLKSRKTKFIATLRKYYKSKSWKWILNKKYNVKPISRPSFKPVYQESRQMTKLISIQGDNSEDNDIN